ncbi:hypothetical protein AB5J62_02170 [Amycolatopsis sp. cg5]|uniref:hypothetical protein n=1 Tax=Amycolatopsis sp. cg5 TaxID=3238802 RepID=UPI0035269C2C
MVTVEVDACGVDRRLAAGELSCPECAGVLVGWGYGRERTVRGPDEVVRLRPRRSRCVRCGVTHVLLPVVALLRRADLASVIGAALVAKAAGAGHRRIAGVLRRPTETVRGWLRCFAARAEAVRSVFTRWVRSLSPDPVMPAPVAGRWPGADAVAAIIAAARALADRFGMLELPLWDAAAGVSGGRLLAPGWPEVLINTSSP